MRDGPAGGPGCAAEHDAQHGGARSARRSPRPRAGFRRPPRPLSSPSAAVGDAETFAGFPSGRSAGAWPSARGGRRIWRSRRSIPATSAMIPDRGWRRQTLCSSINSLAPWQPDRHKLAAERACHSARTRSAVLPLPRPQFPLGSDDRRRDPARTIARSWRRWASRPASRPRQSTRDANACCGRATPTGAAELDRIAERGLTKEFVSARLGAALARRHLHRLLRTRQQARSPARATAHNSWFQEPHSGGLGWSFPCALGAQARRSRSHLRRHHGRRLLPVRQSNRLPSDRRGAWARGPGHRAQQRGVGRGAGISGGALSRWLRGTRQRHAPDLAQPDRRISCKSPPASRGWGRRIERAEDLDGALLEALRVVREERRQALLDVRVLPSLN